MVLFSWLVWNKISLFWALGRVIQLREVVQVVKIGELGPKLNISIDNAFEKVYLVAN